MESASPEQPRSSFRTLLGAALLLAAVVAVALIFVMGGGGDAAIDFHNHSAVDLDGQSIEFDSYDGTPVVLNFFASWCPPCVAEMPALEAIHQDLGSQVAIIGLDPAETAEVAAQLVEEVGVSYQTGLDVDGDLLELYEGHGMPTTVFIDAEGKVADKWIGELTEAEFRDRIDDLFGIE